MTAPTTHHHGTSAQERTGAGKKGVIAGAGLLLACAIACSLPLILAGGLVAGVGAFLAGGEAVALGVVALVAALVGVSVWVRRRRAGAAVDSCGTGCGCGGGC